MLPGGYNRSDSASMSNGSVNGSLAGGAQPPSGGMANNNSSSNGVRPGWGNMPLPMGPYTPQPMPVPSPNGMQGQLVCSGCRTLLVYPQGATNVCCAVCNTVTAVPPPGTEMAQLICGGCRTLLMYVRGATSVQCSCCHTVNLAMEANQVAHVNCGNCCTTLMYPYGAPSVKCAVCHFVTAVGMNNMRMPLPAQRPPTTSGMPPSSSSTLPEQRSQTQTVVVENPMTVDESGKLIVLEYGTSRFTCQTSFPISNHILDKISFTILTLCWCTFGVPVFEERNDTMQFCKTLPLGVCN